MCSDEVLIFFPLGQAFCSASSTLTKIDFLQDFGNLPLIVADGNGLALSASTSPKVSVSEVRAGTKEDEPCKIATCPHVLSTLSEQRCRLK